DAEGVGAVGGEAREIALVAPLVLRDRLAEDGGVRRDAVDRPRLHERAELSGLDHLPGDRVEPDGLTATAVFDRHVHGGLLAPAAAASFLLGVAANGLVDDAFIQFRYAANLAAGHGPVFNPGERIEGASGGLWMALLGALGALTGWDVASLGRFLSLLLAPA